MHQPIINLSHIFSHPKNVFLLKFVKFWRKMIGIIGILGKMGQALVQEIEKDPSLTFCGFSRNLSSLEDVAKKSCVLIDFSSPLLTLEVINIARKYKKPLVIGTTGHIQPIHNLLQDASLEIPIAYAPNFSLGINLLKAILENLPNMDYSINILETHHINKKDKPSGTALDLATLLNKKLNKNIPIQSERLGSVVGEHSIMFDLYEESIVIKHSVKSRQVFAKGALEMAKFLLTAEPGLYSPRDLFSSLGIISSLENQNEKC